MKVKGLVTVTNAIKKYGVQIEQKVQDKITRATDAIEFEAKANKPSGDIKITSIKSDLGGAVRASHIFDDRLAAYIEFGTGRYASALVPSYPNDVQRLAMSYYVNGLGTLPAKPYLIPAYLRQRKIFLSNIRKAVNSIKK